MSFWNPLTCITGCLVVYSVGEFLSKKTKGAVSSLLFACVLFLIGFWSGLLPKDITTQSGLVAVMANFGTAFMIDVYKRQGQDGGTAQKGHLHPKRRPGQGCHLCNGCFGG